MPRSNTDHSGQGMFEFQPRLGDTCISTVSVFFVLCRVTQTLGGGGGIWNGTSQAGKAGGE